MGIGVSIFLMAVGAILAFAVNVSADGINLDTVGVILIILGLVGLLTSLVFWDDWTPRRRALGFDEVRFAVAAGGDASLREWLDAGHQADMAWMERTAEKRMDPSQVLAGVRSIILLGINYWSGSPIQNPKSKIPI